MSIGKFLGSTKTRMEKLWDRLENCLGVDPRSMGTVLRSERVGWTSSWGEESSIEQMLGVAKSLIGLLSGCSEIRLGLYMDPMGLGVSSVWIVCGRIRFFGMRSRIKPYCLNLLMAAMVPTEFLSAFL